MSTITRKAIIESFEEMRDHDLAMNGVTIQESYGRELKLIGNEYKTLKKLFVDDDELALWTKDGKMGVSADGRKLKLLDDEGYPSSHALSPDDADHIVSVLVRERAPYSQWHRRWDSYASANK